MEDLNSHLNGKADPSFLTTAVIGREVSALKELFLIKIECLEKEVTNAHEDLVRFPTEVQEAVRTLKEFHEEKFNTASIARGLTRTIIETRLDGMDKAIKLLQDASDRFPHRIDEKIISLEKVHEEKFSSIDKQFKERDVRVEQTARDTKVAVDAALQAAEKARTSSNESFSLSIAKSESATIKQIDQQGSQMSTSTQALAGQITDIKERLTRIEGHTGGIKDGWGYLVGAVGLIGGIVAIAIVLTR